MATARSCAVCGTELAGNAPEGLCPNCLLGRGLQNPLSASSSALDKTAIATESRTPPTASLPREGQQFGGYRLIRLLGQGGMGAVFETEQLEGERRVALKILNHSLASPEARKRFLREGRTAASINHPNSVYVYGTEEIDGIPVISMELVPGGTLKDRVKLGGPLPAAEAVDVILQVIAGLEAAQTAGVLHRDIKPANCFASPDGAVKVGDFGLSISTLAHGESLLTMAGSVLGTPSFASPEQLRGEELDVRSDIYSVGATLYYLLTGKPPLEAKDLVNLITAVLDRLPDTPKKLKAGVPGGLSKIVMRCLAKERSIRFASYDKLTKALVPFSSVATTPATLGLRFAAGVLDYLFFAGFPALFLFLWIGAEADGNWARQRTMEAGSIYAAVQAWAIAYYGLLEGIWGTSIGKAFFRLKVVGPDGNIPGIPKALLRASLFWLLPEIPFIIPMMFAPDEFLARSAEAVVEFTDLAGVLVTLLVFSTIRRKNGFAGIHELISCTRVLEAAQLIARNRPAIPIDSKTLAASDAEQRVGPYSVVGSFPENRGMLLGYDEKLRRKIWISVVPPGTPPVSALRRDLGRSGRLRWLGGKRSPDECWDAYEALEGTPLLKMLDSVQPWSSVRCWLSDVAEELHAGLKDQSLPSVLGLDRVWITSQGQGVLLDFSAPGGDAASPESNSTLPGCSAGDCKAPAEENSLRVTDVASMQHFLNLIAAAALKGTAIELSNRDSTRSLLPLPVRHERGEGWGEGKAHKDGPPLPNPLLPSEGKRGRRAAVIRFLRLLNSMAVALKGRLADREDMDPVAVTRALPPASSQQRLPIAPLPLHASSFLKSLSDQTFQSSDEVVGDLHLILNKSPVISRRKRLSVSAFWLVILLVFVTSMVSSDAAIERRWNKYWSQTYPKLPSLRAALKTYEALERRYGPHLVRNMNLQRAFDAYLAGNFREIISDSAFWTRPEVANAMPKEHRKIAERALSARPSARGLEVAGGIVKPNIDRAERIQRTKVISSALGIFSMLLVFAAFVDSIMAILFRTSLFINPFGLVLVDKNGSEASRFRIFRRSLIRLLPCLALLVGCVALASVAQQAASARLSFFMILGGVAFVTLLVGAVWLVVKPERGLQDRIVGTWVVPK